MKVVILCGGKGTRLKEETEFRPKPLIKVGERPIVWHIMKMYAHYGFKEFVLCLGYKGEMIKDYFLNYEAMNNDCTVFLGKKDGIRFHNAHEEEDWAVTMVNTGLESGTGARIMKCKPYVGDEPFMVAYGDGVGNIDISRVLALHKKSGKVGVVTGVHPSSRFGELSLDTEGVVRAFNEKPQMHAGVVNAGYFVFTPEIFNYLNDSDECCFEQEPLTRLAADGELITHIHDGFWQCADTYRELELLNSLWKSKKVPWKVW